MAHLKYDYRSDALQRGVSLDIFLPTEMYNKVEPPYKTLYFLPGYSVNSNEIITWLRMRRQAELKGIAIVIPNGDNSFYVDHPERGSNYATFAGKEIVEETRKMLPLSHRREDTFIGGISMGGYGAVVNGVRFKETFSKIGALSPALDFFDMMREVPGAGFNEKMLCNIYGTEEQYRKSTNCIDYLYFDEKSEISRYPELFIACGVEDLLVYHCVKKFADTMKAKNLQFTYCADHGNHELDFWEKMLDPMFSFLLGILEGTQNEIKIG